MAEHVDSNIPDLKQEISSVLNAADDVSNSAVNVVSADKATGASNEENIKIVLTGLECKICNKLYTDARSLSCGHVFCFTCLCTVQMTSESKECPTCHDLTVPPAERVKSLSPDSGTNKRVGIAMLAIVERKKAEALQNRPEVSHFGYTCDGCGESNFTGARFECGVCVDFDLCEECEAKPRKDIHEPTHLFIKLKQPAVITPRQGPALTKEAAKLGKTMNFSGKEHSVDVSELGARVSVQCGSCKTMPIIGARFRCGVCLSYDLCEKCEQNSETNHNRKHPFVKIPHPLTTVTGESSKLLKSVYYT